MKKKCTSNFLEPGQPVGAGDARDTPGAVTPWAR